MSGPGGSTQNQRLKQAYALFQAQRFAEAEDLCRAILADDPDDADTLQLLGAIAHLMGFSREAVPILLRASQLEPRNAGVLRDLAQCQRQSGDHPGAIETTRRRVELEPPSAQAWADLGTLQTEAGELEAARGSLRRAVELVPGFGDAWYALACLKRFEPDDPDLEIMRRELGRPELANNEAVSFNYALGKAYEDLDEPAQAMVHYATGARARHEHLTYDVAAYEEFGRTTIEAFRQLSADSAEADKPRPVFMVGMPRSGSTLLDRMLARHGLVDSVGEFTAFPALVGHLGQLLADRGGYPAGVDRLTAGELDQMAGAYREQLDRAGAQAPVVIDKMLKNYLYCGLLAMVFPSARFIHCRRDPMDTCFSCYTTLFATGQEYSYDLEELGRQYVSYRTLMAHWEALLGERIIAVDYEKLVEEPESVLRGITEFLGLDWDPACLEFAAAGVEAVRTASRSQVRQPLYSSSVGRARRYRAHLEPLLRTLESGGIEA